MPTRPSNPTFQSPCIPYIIAAVIAIATMASTPTAHWLAALPGTLTALRAADQRWLTYRQGTQPHPTLVTQHQEALGDCDWDVVICGGTLGVLLGVTLAQTGWRVALVERGKLQGRVQEWNISRRELTQLVNWGVVSAADLTAAIASEYNPARIQFGAGEPLWVEDVLNVGVSPRRLLAAAQKRFLGAGGTLLEHTPCQGVRVHPDGVAIQAGDRCLTSRLLVDAMGHFSPLVAQARGGARPDGVCLVVGTCAQGFPRNDTGDLIVSFTPIQQQCQYFWEAFPAQDGRTTYLFTYGDAQPERPSLEALFDDYWHWLPDYQGVDLAQLAIQRALFGFFPCYRRSPLTYPWGRILPVGDSSGSQSPLSFGGFGAMVRHLGRLTGGIGEALAADCLGAGDLRQLQPYQPNLSVTWLFQKSMMVGLEQTLEPEQINRTLATIFADMATLGEPTLKPFLQDVVQFPGLAKTLLATTLRHPGTVAKILPQVGLGAIAQWLPHYLALGLYSGLSPLASRLSLDHLPLTPSQRYRYRRWVEGLQYGAGQDYGWEETGTVPR